MPFRNRRKLGSGWRLHNDLDGLPLTFETISLDYESKDTFTERAIE